MRPKRAGRLESRPSASQATLYPHGSSALCLSRFAPRAASSFATPTRQGSPISRRFCSTWNRWNMNCSAPSGLSVLWADDSQCRSVGRALSVSCDYSGAVRFEEVLDVALRVARLGEKSVTYEFEFACAGRRDRARAARWRSAAACRTGDPPESVPIPEPIAAKLRPFA